MINCNRHFKNSIAIATPFPGVGFTWGFLHREGTDRIFMFYMPRIADYCTNCPSILFPSKYWTVNFFCTLHVRNFQRRMCHCVSVRQAICNAWQIGNWVSPTTFGLRSWVGYTRFTCFTNLPDKNRLQYSSEVAACRPAIKDSMLRDHAFHVHALHIHALMRRMQTSELALLWIDKLDKIV